MTPREFAEAIGGALVLASIAAFVILAATVFGAIAFTQWLFLLPARALSKRDVR